MWVIRGGEQNRLVDRFVDDGVTGVGYYEVPDAEILTRTEIRRLLVAEGTSAAVDAHVAMLAAFVREVQVGDSVLMPDTPRGEVVIGEVTGRYEFHADLPAEDYRHRRAVRWLARHGVDELPASVQGVVKQRQTLRQDRDAAWSDHVRRVRAGDVGRDPKDRRPVTRPRPSGGRTSGGSRATAAPTMRTCPSCHLQWPPSRFAGDLCVDCAE